VIFVMDATIGQACESQVNNLVYILFFDLLEVLVKTDMHFDSILSW